MVRPSLSLRITFCAAALIAFGGSAIADTGSRVLRSKAPFILRASRC